MRDTRSHGQRGCGIGSEKDVWTIRMHGMPAHIAHNPVLVQEDRRTYIWIGTLPGLQLFARIDAEIDGMFLAMPEATHCRNIAGCHAPLDDGRLRQYCVWDLHP